MSNLAERVRPLELPSAQPEVFVYAGLGRRAAAYLLDLLILAAAYLWVVTFELALVEAEVASWVTLLWLLVVGPLYFGLYHSYGTGSTPGQLEVGISVRDAATGGLAEPRRALLRSYLGLLPPIVVADLLVAPADERHRTVRDRICGTSVIEIVLPSEQDVPRRPTTPALEAQFEASLPGRRLARARALLRSNRRAIIGPVLATYVGLVAIALVLAPLLLADFTAGDEWGYESLLLWLVLTLLVFVSGIYWTQAVVVVAVESMRVGRPAPVREVFRQILPRVNALTAAIVVLSALGALTYGLAWYVIGLALVPVAARLTLVVPAIVVERRGVLDAFRRSWSLLQGRTWRATGMLVASGFALTALVVVAAIVASLPVAFVADEAAPMTYALAVGIGLLLAALPVSAGLALIGTAWALLYDDARCAGGTSESTRGE